MNYLNKSFWQMSAGFLLTLVIALLLLSVFKAFNKEDSQIPANNYVANTKENLGR